MRLKSILSACVLAAASAAGTQLRAQSLEPFNPYGIFSPSVEAWQMTRYGNLSPSLYTGAMTFSLPLYTYEDPDFTIPISLEYSFDGYRPAQHSGTVGYGWYLNCGGVITREVRGLPDEGVSPSDESYQLRVLGWFDACKDGVTGPYLQTRVCSAHRLRYNSSASSDYVAGFMSYGTFSDTPACMIAESLYPIYDMQPDVWHFSFLGHYGDFIMMKDGSIRVFNSDFPSGQANVSIDYFSQVSSSLIVTIDTGDGYKYVFTSGDHSYTYSDNPGFAYDPPEVITSLRLSSITAPNGRKAEFYASMSEAIKSEIRYGVEVNGVYTNNSIDSFGLENFGTIPDQSGKKFTLIRAFEASVGGIKFYSKTNDLEASQITFSYGSAAKDEYSSSCFDNPYAWIIGTPGPQSLLKSITVYNDSGHVVEKMDLSHVCAGAGTPKSFLSTVTTLNRGRWMFDYALSGYTLPFNNTQGTDHWGYWNGSSVTDLRDHVRHPGTYIIEEAHTEIGADSTEVLIPAVYGYTSVNHLYDQMEDGTREANAYYARCGAMTRITYPTGGHTEINYEGNSAARRINAHFPSDELALEYVSATDPYSTYSVGGVRVSSITDTDENGGSYTRTFSYETPSRMPSGLLMRMPKYVEDAIYIHHASTMHTYYPASVACHALISLRMYSSTGSIEQCNDSHIAYPHVRETYPDGSYIVYSFSSAADNGGADTRSNSGPIEKRVISNLDWIEPYNANDADESCITVDRSRKRGHLVSETTCDPSGNVLRNIETEYGYDMVSIGDICRNGKYHYKISGYSIVYPYVSSRTETLHGVTHREEYTYNARKQPSTVSKVCGLGALADTVKIYYKYVWEADSTAFPSGLSAAVCTHVCDGGEYVTRAESYCYDDYSSLGNTKPTSITVYAHEGYTTVPSGSTADAVLSAGLSGGCRTSIYGYNTIFRLTDATYPGNASLAYEWTGHNPVKRIENGESVHIYTWLDLVGPTSITSPSGTNTGYIYDTENRLRSITDGKGRTVCTYDYHLLSEE